MKVRVLLFAGLRDLFKESEIDLSLPEGSTLKDLEDKLFADKKNGHWKSIHYAVNETYADIETKLKDGDEVAFLPMVSGG